MTTSSNPVSTQRTGLHIYMGGVGMQLLTICIFLALCIRFQIKIRRQEQAGLAAGQGIHMKDFKSPIRARHPLYVVYTILGLIVYRNIYRLIEFSSGVNSNITEHEWYTYVFDSTAMFFALVAFNILHPGNILRGPNSDFSEDKKRAKTEKKEKKRVKVEAKAEKKAAKAEAKTAKKDEAQRKKEERRGYVGKVDSI